MNYKTLSNLLIFPENDITQITSLATSQDWELDKPFILKHTTSNKPKFPFLLPTTIREALVKFCDLNKPLLQLHFSK